MSGNERGMGNTSRTNVEDWTSKFNVTKMPRAFFWSFFTSLTVVLTVNCTKTGVIDTLCTRPLALIILSRR